MGGDPGRSVREFLAKLVVPEIVWAFKVSK
jgi:hypothetical protein